MSTSQHKPKRELQSVQVTAKSTPFEENQANTFYANWVRVIIQGSECSFTFCRKPTLHEMVGLNLNEGVEADLTNVARVYIPTEVAEGMLVILGEQIATARQAAKELEDADSDAD